MARERARARRVPTLQELTTSRPCRRGDRRELRELTDELVKVGVDPKVVAVRLSRNHQYPASSIAETEACCPSCVKYPRVEVGVERTRIHGTTFVKVSA